MIIEFQLSSDILVRLFRNFLHNSELCVKDSFNIWGNSWMIDRILVLPTTSLRRDAASVTIDVNGYAATLPGGSKAVLVQPLQINLVRVSDLTASGPNPTAPALTPQFTILIDIHASVQQGEAWLQFTFNSIDFGLTEPEAIRSIIVNDPSTQEMILNLVSSKVPSDKRKIDLVGNLQKVPVLEDISLAITNAGCTASQSGDIFILRVEVNGGPMQVHDWNAFHTTYNRNLVGTGNWAILIDKGILIPCIKKTIGASLAAASDEFAADGSVDVSWTPSVGPVFEVTFSGEVIDACTCLWHEQDVNVDVSSTIVLEAGLNDTLYMGVNTTYDANDAEVACCALTASAFWPVVGLIYMGKDEGSYRFAKYLLGYVMSPIGFTFIAVCNFASNQSITKYLPLPGGCEKVDDEMFSCNWPFAPNMGAFGGTFHLTKVGAQAEGPILSGIVTGITDLADPEFAIGSLRQFTWALGGSCSTGFEPQLTAQVLYYNTAFGTILKVCKVSILEDPLHIFKITKVGEYATTVRATPSTSYLANPYPCKLQIVSNGGVRVIRLAPAHDITVEQAAKLQDELSVAKQLCQALSIAVPKKIIRWMQPDPAVPFTIDNAQIWQVVIAGLNEGESVDLLVDDIVAATGIAHGRGVVELSLWAEGHEHRDEISVMLHPPNRNPPSGGREERKRHVSVKQIQLVLRSRIDFVGDFEDMGFSRAAGQTLLSIQTSQEEVQYDVTIPHFSSLWFSRRRRAGGQTELVLRDGLHVFRGDEEIRRAVVASLPTEGITRIEAAKIAGAKRAVTLCDRNGTTRVVDVSDLNSVREIARYFRTPWFVGTRRRSGLFAKLASDGKHVALYEMQRVIDT